MRQRILLVYSGGAAATAAIPRLAAQYDADVVTVTVDLGQDVPLDQVRECALASGAVRAHVIDARAEFARDYVLPALRTGAVYDGHRLRAASLGRPLIARKLVDIAQIEQTDTIACDGGELERAVRGLGPQMRVVSSTSPDVPVVAPHAAGHARSLPNARVRNLPAHLAIAFEHGVPISINGVAMEPIELLESVATIAVGHGVGVDDDSDSHIEERTICETPAAIVLQAAHQALGASLARAQERVSGVVRLMLSNGACIVEGVEAQAAPTLAMVAEPL